MYLRNDIAATSSPLLTFSNGAVDIVAVHSSVENIVIAVIYRRPDDSTHNRPSNNHHFKPAIMALQNSINAISSTPDIIIGGDFNLPHTQWPDCAPMQSCPREEKEMTETLHNFSNELLLSQLVNKATHYQGNILDLVLTNNSDLVSDIEIQPSLRSISHHNLINISTQYKAPINIASVKPQRLSPLDKYNYHNKDTDWQAMKQSLGNNDWEEILRDKQPTEILDILYEKLLNCTESNVPLRQQPKNNQLSRSQRERNNLTRKRRRINKQYQKATSVGKKTKLYNELINIEIKLQKLANNSAQYKEKKACEAIQSNSKFFFSYANQKRKVKTSIGPLLNKATKNMTTDSKEMAELLADQYDSVFSKPSPEPQFLNPNVSQTIQEINITPEEIIDAIKELRPSSASGPDGVPAILLRNCSTELALPLSILWREIFRSSNIPEKLKFSLIPPIHKGGSKSEPANYRPVALTSHIIKVLEKVVRNKLVDFLESNGHMNDNQHGFRSGRSCLTQLLKHHDQIISLMEQHQNVDVVYLDFSKAFDKVDHNIVLAKAHNMGVQGKLLDWIREFLTNRKQSVVVNGSISSPRPVISGVPQGSVIGPLIFLILISDIDHNTLHSLIASFADDTRATKGLANETDAVDLQEDLFHIYQWSVTNNMEFNDLKFELLRYGTNTELKHNTSYISPTFKLIEEKDAVKDLGVTLSSDATFKQHINNVIESAKNMCSWILRTFTTRQKDVMITLYKSLVRPILEYASALWSPINKGDIQKLEQIQQSFIRKIKGISKDYHIALKQLNLYSLERRRERYIIIQVWKMLEGLAPNLNPSLKIQVNMQQRRGRTLHVHKLATTPSHLQQIKRQSIRCYGVKLFNSLPKAVRNITNTSTEKFKHALDKFLQCVADIPYLRSGVNNSSANSNHIYDSPTTNQSYNPISTTVEQNTTSQHLPPHQETQSESPLLRRLSTESLTTSC